MREGPTSTGRPSAASVDDAGQRRDAVLGALGEAEAGIDDDLIPRHAAAQRPLDGAGEVARHVGGDLVVRGRARTCRPGRPRMCISTSGAPRTAAMSPTPGSYCSPLMSLRRLTPSSRPKRATSALVVSIDSGTRTPVQLPQHRHQPGALLAGR